METRVLIWSSRKPNAVNPPPQWCFWWSLIMIGQLVSEILMFESVDGRTHGRTHGRRLESHTISSPWAFGSGELKIRSKQYSNFMFLCTTPSQFLSNYVAGFQLLASRVENSMDPEFSEACWSRSILFTKQDRSVFSLEMDHPKLIVSN